MAHAPVPDAVLGTIAIVLAWGLAAWVLMQGPRRPMNRLLALLLYLEGAFQWINWNDPAAWGWFADHIAAFFIGPALWGLPFAYFLLLAHLDTRATAWLRHRLVKRSLIVVFAALMALIVPLSFYILVHGDVPVALGPFEPLMQLGFVFTGLVSVYAFIAAILAYRRATDRVVRARAKTYVVAFGVRDLLLATGILLYVPGFIGLIGPEYDPLLDPWRAALPTLASIAFVPLLTLGLVRTGMLGVDTRTRMHLQPVTLAFLLLGTLLLAATGLMLWIEPLTGSRIAFGVLVLLFLLLFAVFRIAQAGHDARLGDGPIVDDDRIRIGRRLAGRYRVLHELGKGAHGTAWLAQDTTLGRTVVIKTLDARSHDPYPEAQRLAAVKDPYVVQVHDLIRAGDHVHLVLEHVPGGTLRAHLERTRIPERHIQRLGNMLLGAIGAVHRAGLVHRDVKPANIFLAQNGEIRLGDFGVTKPLTLEETVAYGAMRPTSGTVPYMSPEQATGRKVGPASDLYSAALVLYEVLAGSPYWAARPGESALELQHRIAQRRARPEASARVPPHLRSFFERALAPEPQARYMEAGEMKHAWNTAWATGGPVLRASTVQEQEPGTTDADQVA